MRRSPTAALVAVLVLAVVGLAFLPSAADARSRSQSTYLRAAEKGVKATGRWWSRYHRWYTSVLGGPNVASLWGIVPLFQALNGLQTAQPSRRHRHMLNRFARGAERYLNLKLEPVPGFGPKPGQGEPGKTTWFDDNGWWGLSFLDAYQATGNPRYLYDAQLAQQFISVSGWDTTPGRPGGIWWNTNQSFYAGESLAGGTLLSARLFAITHEQRYLDDALKYIAWGDVWLTDPATGLYARLRKPGTYPAPVYDAQEAAAADRQAVAQYPEEAAKLEAGQGAGGARAAAGARAAGNYPPFAPSPMPYVNGPMILAHRIICDQTGDKHYCERAEQLAWTTINVYRHFWMGPQFDFWYLREMLELNRLNPNPFWLGIAQQNARRALHRVRDKHGLYLRTWYGKKASVAGAPKGSVQLHAANTALFAWMAALGR
jgi:hypothetical protein